MDDTHVTFRWKDRNSDTWQTERILGVQFLQRFLQHVLPRGFHRCRYYGLWHSSRRDLSSRAWLLLMLENPLDEVVPVTIEPHFRIDAALRKMKVAGVRLLLVPDVEDNIIGIITATDILGDLPLRKGQELEMPHHDLHVDMIMTPLEEMLAVDMVTVRDARVGHIISTLRNHERQHMLVVEIDRMTQQHMIRGLFSTSQISKLVSHDITDPEYAAHTLADVYHELG